jgi:type I restriction enzyme M protein
MNNFGEKVAFIWSVADLLRDAFKRSKYPDVILPLTVLRRLDCVLEPSKDKVLAAYAKLKDKLENLAPQLRKASGFAFYNTSPFTFERLLGDAKNLAANLRAYINGFSDNMREVVEKFDFDNTISKLDDAGLLFLVLERFKNIDLHPDKVSNLEMGYVFEELIRKFNEAMDENPGEHFTPREVIRLMVNLLLTRDREALKQNHIVRTVYDPCCGSGGMLTIAKERILEINPNADVHLFGQEVNPETFAVCKSDLYMKSLDGRDAENIQFGSTLGNDRHADKHFDYLLSNPPYGKEWKMDKEKVEAEAERGYAGRFGAGLPRISDGQLLFLQHMLSRMKDSKDGGSRVAIVMNGSPLFTGDAGSGESEIRRWILENDWLESIVALPEQLFYNTGIPTYVWVLTNRKPTARKGKVQLIDATAIWTPMRKSLGDKRRAISPEQIEEIARTYEVFRESEQSRIFSTAEFGYRKITVERPLRLNFQASPQRIERLKRERVFQSLATSKKKGKAGEAEIEAGRKVQETLLLALEELDAEKVWKNREAFRKCFYDALIGCGLKVPASFWKVLLSALSERDETAEVCFDADGHPEPDPELRDTENVPLGEDVQVFFDREVKPHVPDAWINTAIRDHKDGEVGKVGYEISFNRYFYQYQPPRPLEEIEADIKALEKDIVTMLKEVAG